MKKFALTLIAVLGLLATSYAETDYLVQRWLKVNMGVENLESGTPQFLTIDRLVCTNVTINTTNMSVTTLATPSAVITSNRMGIAVVTGPLTAGTLSLTNGGAINGSDLVMGTEPVVSQAPVAVGNLANGGFSTNTLLATINLFAGNSVVYTNYLVAPGAANLGKVMYVINTVATNMHLLDAGTTALSGELTLGADDGVMLYGVSTTKWLQIATFNN